MTEIRIFEDFELLSKDAAEMFAEYAEKTISSKGSFSAVLSGGSTPKHMYELLASLPYRNRIMWDHVNFFWGDERCVSPNDEKSNYRMARKTLLDHIPVVRNNIHPIQCKENPEQAAVEYEREIMKFFNGEPVRFDLVILGLGENGHTASLFPGTDILHENVRLAGSLNVQGEEYQRLSLTVRTINQAAVIVFLVSGVSKASIVKKTLKRPEGSGQIPAQMISPAEGELIWLIDRDAASLLINQ